MQYSLISIRDFGTADHPVAETGEEEVIYTPGGIYVATRSDVDGDVRSEVGEPEPHTVPLFLQPGRRVEIGGPVPSRPNRLLRRPVARTV
ncbi:hypothetical protein ACWD4J_22775 [Streptomyces sp. NPDC002577]